jgi:glutathione S-transferase
MSKSELYGHPFSSYTWKALIPFYETGTPFDFRVMENPDNAAALATVWPLGKFPVLVDDGEAIIESSIIVEHVAPHLIPADRDAAREVRMLDRIFDHHVMDVATRVVLAAIKGGDVEAARTEAATALDKVYGWLDKRLDGRTWAAGEEFTLADCAGAPSLFYADWVHEIGPEFATLRAYRERVLARPSVVRCVEDARPYRHYFPLGAPDRD